MKRLFSLVLALCLMFGAALLTTYAQEKRVYLDFNQDNGLYRVDLCWTGAEKEDDIGGIRVSFSYDQDLFTVEKFELGESLKDFSIKMGPQYNESYPLIFLAANGSEAADTEGVLASVWLKAKGQIDQATDLDLTLMEMVRFSDNAPITGLFTVEGLSLDFTGAKAEPEVTVISQETSDSESATNPDTPETNADLPGESDGEPAPEKDIEGSTPDGDEAEAIETTGETRDPMWVITVIVVVSCAALAIVVAILFAVVQRRRKAERMELARETVEEMVDAVQNQEDVTEDPKEE